VSPPETGSRKGKPIHGPRGGEFVIDRMGSLREQAGTLSIVPKRLGFVVSRGKSYIIGSSLGEKRPSPELHYRRSALHPKKRSSSAAPN